MRQRIGGAAAAMVTCACLLTGLASPAPAVTPAGPAGPATEAELRAELDASFGGAWLDRHDQRLVVAVTDEAAADRARALGVRSRLVAHDEAELTAARAGLDRTPAPASVFAWGVDITKNQVFVRADPAALPETEAFVKASGADPALVRIEASTQRPRLAAVDEAGRTATDQPGPAALALRGGDGWGDATLPSVLAGWCATGEVGGGFARRIWCGSWQLACWKWELARDPGWSSASSHFGHMSSHSRHVSRQLGGADLGPSAAQRRSTERVDLPALRAHVGLWRPCGGRSRRWAGLDDAREPVGP